MSCFQIYVINEGDYSNPAVAHARVIRFLQENWGPMYRYVSHETIDIGVAYTTFNIIIDIND